MSEAILIGVIVVIFLYIIFCMSSPAKKPKRAAKSGGCGAAAYQSAKKPQMVPNPDSMIPVDHSQYIQDMGLQDSIKDSHERFTQEIHQRSTGASAETVFSHDTDVVPWRGLRRPNYNVEISEHAREIPSVLPEHVPKYRPFVL